jgi:hypothetical protein
MDPHEWDRAAYARRKHKRVKPEPELPTEMTAAGYAMEAELEHRRAMARKEALRLARLKKHKLYAVTLRGGEVKQ